MSYDCACEHEWVLVGYCQHGGQTSVRGARAQVCSRCGVRAHKWTMFLCGIRRRKGEEVVERCFFKGTGVEQHVAGV